MAQALFHKGIFFPVRHSRQQDLQIQILVIRKSPFRGKALDRKLRGLIGKVLPQKGFACSYPDFQDPAISL